MTYLVMYFLIFCMSSFLLWFLSRQKSPLSCIPGPTPLPLIGNALMMLGPTEDVWLPLHIDLRNKYGNIVKFQFGTTFQIFLYGAETVEKIFSSSQQITKGYQYEFFWPWLAQGLLTSTGRKWQKHRKLLTPAFHFRILEDFLHTMNDHAHTLLGKIGENVGGFVDIYPMITHCSLDIICETTMGVSINAQNDGNSEYVKAVCGSLELLLRRMISPWVYNDWIYHRTEAGRKWLHNLDILHAFSMKIIKERKEEITNETHEDYNEDEVGIKKRMAFLDLLIQASEDGLVLSDQDIQEEVDTFMFEGHDTTAFNVAMTLYLLAFHRDIQRKCQVELEDIFGDTDRLATSSDLANMKYLSSCIKESLRLYGSVPSIGRVTSEDVEIEGHIIPAGTEIACIIAVLHRDPKYFPDPERFDPERFFGDQDQERHPYAYTPFAAGPRNCIGQKFAMMEVKVILSSILRKFNTIAEVEPKNIVIAPELVLKPRKGLHVKFEHKSN